MKRFIIKDDLNHNPYVEGQGIEGMSRVGTIGMRGSTYEIFVCTNDPGKIPHFHLRDVDDWSRFHTCIRIDKAEYFHHGSKQDMLNNKEKKQLDQFMKSTTKKKIHRPGADPLILTNWEYICILWDDNNSDVELPDDIIQPDYSKLK